MQNTRSTVHQRDATRINNVIADRYIGNDITKSVAAVPQSCSLRAVYCTELRHTRY